MRYLMVGLATFGTLLVAFIAVVLGHGVVDRVTCSPEFFWSGTCYDLSERPLLVLYEHLSVAFVCLAVGFMAVYSSAGLNRAAVIRTSYIVGGFMLVLITVLAGRHDLAVSGLSVGLFLSMYLHRRYVQNAANHSLQARPP